MNSYALDNVREATLQENATPTTPPTNGITIFAYGDKLQFVNDTGAIYQVASLADLAAYLARAGGTMTGAINMGAQEINNVSAIRTTDNIIVGTNAVVTGLGSTSNVLLGRLFYSHRRVWGRSRVSGDCSQPISRHR